MNILIDMLGSMGFVLLSMNALFLVFTRNSTCPTEFYLYQGMIVVALKPLFQAGMEGLNMVAGYFIIFLFMVFITFPFRGLSYQTKLSTEDVGKGISELLGYYPRPFIHNRKYLSYETKNGIKVLVRPSFKDKYREIYIMGGYRINKILLVKKQMESAIFPVKSIREQRKTQFQVMILGALMLGFYIFIKTYRIVA